MEFKVGDLIRLKKTHPDGGIFPAVGMILKVYSSKPLIFLNNQKMNDMWLEQEDIEKSTVYDIIYEGVIEEAVLAEWLAPWLENI